MVVNKNNKMIKMLLVLILIVLGVIIYWGFLMIKKEKTNFLDCENALVIADNEKIVLYCEKFIDYKILENDNIVVSRNYESDKLSEVYDSVLFDYINSYLFLNEFGYYENILIKHYDSFIENYYYTTKLATLFMRGVKFSNPQLEIIVEALTKINNDSPETTHNEIATKIGNVNILSIILETYLKRSDEAQMLNNESERLWEKLRNLVKPD